MSVVGLERALHNYTLEPSDTPFDLKTVPLATQPMIEQKAAGELSFLHLSSVLIQLSLTTQKTLQNIEKPNGCD